MRNKDLIIQEGYLKGLRDAQRVLNRVLREHDEYPLAGIGRQPSDFVGFVRDAFDICEAIVSDDEHMGEQVERLAHKLESYAPAESKDRIEEVREAAVAGAKSFINKNVPGRGGMGVLLGRSEIARKRLLRASTEMAKEAIADAQKTIDSIRKQGQSPSYVSSVGIVDNPALDSFISLLEGVVGTFRAAFAV